MADNKNQSSPTSSVAMTGDTGLQLQEIALTFAAERSTQHGLTRGMAISCFRDAKTFMEVANEALSGKLDSKEGLTALDAAFAPNLKRSHPINLMSSEWGDLEKVKKVLDDLNQNVAADRYEPLEWGKQEVNQARALFPAVIERAKSLQLVK